MSQHFLTVSAISLIFTALSCGYAGDAPVAISYTSQIAPIMSASCVSCHGAQKQKGGLRLDSPEWIGKGGKNGPAIVAGKPGDSPLYARTILPAKDDDHMPAKGKPLTDEQTEAIRAWIAAGATFDVPAAPAAPAPVAPVPAPSLAPAPAPTPQSALPPVPAADAAAVTALTAIGVQVTPLLGTGGGVAVAAAHTPTPFADAHVTAIAALGAAVVTLDVSGSAITDAQMKTLLAALPNLERLDCARTGITGTGLSAAKNSPRLSQVNAYASKLDDAGLLALGALPALTQVVVFQSAVSPAATSAFISTHPSVQVVAAPDFAPLPADDDGKPAPMKKGKKAKK